MSKRKRIISIVSLCLLACIAVGAFVMAERSSPKPAKLPEGMEYGIGNTVAIGHFEYMRDTEFFVDDWDGTYDLQYIRGSSAELCWGSGVMDYDQYQEFCSMCGNDGYVQTYDDPSQKYIFCSDSECEGTTYLARLAAVKIIGDVAHMYVWYQIEYDPSIHTPAAYMIVVPTDQEVHSVRVHFLYYTADQYEEVKQYDVEQPEPEKPILYLYPERETNVTVALGHPECVTHSYPKYDGPWRVKAQPDGTLTDLNTGRELYSLYYENVSSIPLPQTDEGFVVRGSETAAFLEAFASICGSLPLRKRLRLPLRDRQTFHLLPHRAWS